jgi:hypothetical protein
MKEYYVPYTLRPQYNKEGTELYFVFLVCTYMKLNFQIIIFQIPEHQNQL